MIIFSDGIKLGFKEGFRRAIKEKGITQKKFHEQFCAYIGKEIPKSSVNNWAQGRSVPEYDTIEQLCNFFECDLDYLFGRLNCKSHDDNFIHQKTGLTETSIATLYRMNEIDPASIQVLNHIVTSGLLDTLTAYYCAQWDTDAHKFPYGALLNAQRISPELTYMNLLNKLPQNTQSFYQQSRNEIDEKVSLYRYIRASMSEVDLNKYRKYLFDSKDAIAGDSYLRAMAELFFYTGEYDLFKRGGIDLESLMNLPDPNSETCLESEYPENEMPF